MLWHITLAADERLTLFPSAPLVRRAVRALAASVPRALVFQFADDHLHVVDRGSRVEVGHRVQGLSHALGVFAAAPLGPARVREITSRGHLESTVRYVLRQATHHGLPAHPAADPGSSFADLVGARAVGFSMAPLSEELPRLSLNAVYGMVGLSPTPARPPASLASLAAAAAEVVAMDDLRGRAYATLAARVAFVHAALDAGFTARVLADHLAVSDRAVRRHAATAPSPVIAASLARRLSMEAALAATGQPTRR